MANQIDFMAASAGEILRPNRFKMKIYFPNVIAAQTAQEISETFVLSTEVPGKSLGIVEVPVQGGHTYKVPGDTTVPDWTVTMIGDPDYTLYRGVQRWQEYCNSIQTGTRSNDLTNFGSALVEQLDGLNQTVQTWELIKIFPMEIGTITFSKEERDSFLQFDVTWAVNDIITNLV